MSDATPTWLPIAAVTALALAIRLVAVGDTLTHDEGYTWLVASAPDLGGVFDRLAAYENTPPLLYVLLHVLPHDGEAWLRLPSLAASVACVPLVHAIARRLLDPRAALPAALALAVAPQAVANADLSRAFPLAVLGGLLALHGGLARRDRWFVVGATLALWSEYDALLFLVAVVVALRLWRWAVLVPLLLFAPWVPETLRGLDAVDVTKVAPLHPRPGLAELPRVFLGDHLATLPVALVLLAVLAVAAARLPPLPRRVLGGTFAATLALHAAVSVAGGPALLSDRYLQWLLPLGCLLGASLLVAVLRPVSIGLAIAGCALGVHRATDVAREPDPARYQAATAAARVVLTNSAVVVFYVRQARLDRPFGLGPGDPEPPGTAVLDDARVGDGPRRGPGPSTVFTGGDPAARLVLRRVQA